MLLLVWLSFQVVVYYLDRALALDAARHGLATARVAPPDPARAVGAAREYLRAGDGWLQNIEVTAGSDGTRITVTVSGTAGQLVPFVRLAVTQTASGPIEQLP